MLKRIYKTENIIKVSPEDALSHVVSLLSTSHDSAFVIDESDKLLGVINPYYCIIKKSYPANTKAKNCLFHPPKVDVKTSIQKVIRLMIETKVHYLPVLEKDMLVGIISARRILQAIAKSDQLRTKVGDYTKRKRTLISVFEDDFISRAMTLFKQHKISKLIVISRDFKLRGVLAYYDLISYLAAPTQRQQVAARVGNKVPRLQKARVRNFMKTHVLTVTSSDTLARSVQLILEHGIGSVVVVDPESHPTGIITTKDVLSAYLKGRNVQFVQVIAKGLTKGSAAAVSGFVSQINRMLSKREDIIKATLTVKEKVGSGVYEAILAILPKGENQKVIHEEGKNLDKVLRGVKKKAKRVKKKVKRRKKG